MIFYILNGVPTTEANSAREAARAYALATNISAGTITVATSVKAFDVTETPRDIQVTDK